MKAMKTLAKALFCLLVTTKAHTQDNFYVQKTDSAFMYLDKTSITTNILYNRAYPFAELDTYSLTADTTEARWIEQAYFEMYHAAYNKSSFVLPSDLEDIADMERLNQRVPLAVIDYNMQYIRQDAITQNLISFSNGFFYDVPNRPSSPYITKRIQMAGPLSETVKSGVITFSLRNLLCLNNSGLTVQSVILNFGALGSLTINVNQTASINITTEGIINFTVTINYTNGQQFINKSRIIVSSTSGNTRVLGADPETGTGPCFSEVKSSTIPFQGYDESQAYNGWNTVNYYYRTGASCNGTPQTLNKPIIVIDGFDPTNKRRANQIYDEAFFFVDQNGSPQNIGQIMRSQGYDLVIVNHPDYTEGTRTIQTPNGSQTIDRFIHGGGDYIERNAMVLVKIIQDINAQLQQQGSTEKIVIVGPSMGGQISRIALKYMENNNMNHNCRLWVSMDSPHKGSVLPIGLQGMARALASLFYKADASLRDQINSAAAKQMLIHHHLSNSELPAGAPGYFDTYYTYINNLGWPQNLRKIAGNSGAHNGSQQSPGFTCNNVLNIYSGSGALTILLNSFFIPTLSSAKVRLAPSKAQSRCLTADIRMTILGQELINFQQYSQNNSSLYNQSLEMLPGGYYPGFKEITDSLSSTNQRFFNSIFDLLAWKKRKNGKYPDVTKAFDNHVHIPTASALAYGMGPNPNPNRKWDDDVSQLNLAIPCEGEIPFDGYFGPLNFNTRHDSLFNDQALWFLDEVNGNPRYFTKHPSVTIQSSKNYMCNGETLSFSISQPLSGMTYNWTTSHPNLQITSGWNTPTVTIVGYGLSAGYYVISCQSPGPCYSFNANFTIHVGGYSSSDYPVSGPSVSCNNTYVYFSTNVLPGATDYVWFWPASNWTYISGNHTPYLALRTGTASGPVGVRVANACDPGGSPGIKFVQVNNCGWRFHVSPNPTNGDIVVSTTEEQKQSIKGINQIKIYQLRIIDQTGNVKKQYRFPGGITNVNISTSNMAAGIYVIQAYNGKTWEATKFVKQ